MKESYKKQIEALQSEATLLREKLAENGPNLKNQFEELKAAYKHALQIEGP